MPDSPKKSPFDLLLPLAPRATPEDEAEARRLGVTVDDYRARKLEATWTVARREAIEPRAGDTPPDIAAEAAEAHRRRLEPGLLKPRDAAPNLLVQAARTPGEVALMILFVLLYAGVMIGLVILGGENAQNLPGIFQVIVLGLLVFPVLWLTRRLWEAMGEKARDLCRALIRFWPLTLIALILMLGALKLMLGGGSR